MAKQITDVEIHASDILQEDNLDVSVENIDVGLYLGNVACARDTKVLKELKITHILTIDLVPLPRSILERSNLTFKFIKLADVPKEDLISHLPESYDFIKQAIARGGVVLVHCYFGVSRSAAVVVAYIMQKHRLCYDEAIALVTAKHRFASPNVGFVAQLKLYGHMGCTINRDDPRFKQFRLRMAGQKMKQVKILPQLFADLVKPDPGLARERPQPVVYRCRHCRRVVASQANIIPHLPKQVKIDLAKKKIRPPPSKFTGLTCAENGQLLIDKLKSLACQILEPCEDAAESVAAGDEGPSQWAEADGYHELLADGRTARADEPHACRLMWFVEPMAWMRGVQSCAHGKLHCPKCQHKIGSFSWVMGCTCPCGQKVAPAFYLVPSKVEWSNIVQNVQTTV